MPDGVYLERLEEIIADLKSTIDEFDDAGDISKDIAGLVGEPMGKSDLKNKVRDFENDWNKNRGKLKENLESVHEHLSDIDKGFKKWDEDAQKAFLNSRANDDPKAKK